LNVEKSSSGQLHFFLFICRSIAVYGCFAAGLASLIVFAAISWFSGKTDSDNTEETTSHIALSREIRITVYLITAVLAIASSITSLIEVDQIVGNDVVPVRVSRSLLLPIISSIITRRAKGMKFFPSEILSSPANVIYLIFFFFRNIILFVTIQVLQSSRNLIAIE